MNCRSVELTLQFKIFAHIKVPNTHIQYSSNTLPWVNLVGLILRMAEDMCTSFAFALDDADNGERCISMDTWHGYACVESISPQVQVHTCAVALIFTCYHTYTRYIREDMFVSAMALHLWEWTMLDGSTNSNSLRISAHSRSFAF